MNNNIVRAKFIYEKFVEDSDPIRDLGIGLYVKRDFQNYDQAVDFMLKAIPVLLNRKGIPKDYISQPGWYTNSKYRNKIKEYRNSYITVNGKQPMQLPWCIYTKLKSMGFKTSMDESLNEKFVQDGDPIKHMGIGGKRGIEDYIKTLKGTVSQEEVDDFIVDFSLANASGADVYLPYKQREKLYFLSKILGKQKIRVTGIDMDDDVPGVVDEGGQKYEYLYEKRVEPLLKKGWEIFYNEDNIDYHEFILVKYS